jgi:uncharacterized protein
MDLKDKAKLLEENLASVGLLLVAYSGGTDSAYLAYAAHRALGERMLAVIADSPSLPRKELADAMAFAERHGIPVRVLQTNELESMRVMMRNDASIARANCLRRWKRRGAGWGLSGWRTG